MTKHIRLRIMLQNIPMCFGLLVLEETGVIMLANWKISHLSLVVPDSVLETEWEVSELDKVAESGTHVRQQYFSHT